MVWGQRWIYIRTGCFLEVLVKVAFGLAKIEEHSRPLLLSKSTALVYLLQVTWELAEDLTPGQPSSRNKANKQWDPPLYFKSFIWTEYLIQLPLHIANAYAFLYGKKWGRMTGIIYGVHVATTMVPILADILTADIPTRGTLLGIYIPYLLIPILIVARLLPYSDPFGAPVLSSSDKKNT
ncbi:hypothetical protein R1flu_011189 [Riccia fluitans]|uniref:EXPERA domain-containing protein n=1 Tax=Riccia fluitans TaxID=41844 RepID=A0ABD1Z749_9MARC